MIDLYPWQREFLKEFREGMKKAEAKAALARFKQNSSYFMRKDANPLIVKREGLTKDNILTYIIAASKALDAMACRSKVMWIPTAQGRGHFHDLYRKPPVPVFQLKKEYPVLTVAQFMRSSPPKVVIESTPRGNSFWHEHWAKAMDDLPFAKPLRLERVFRSGDSWEYLKKPPPFLQPLTEDTKDVCV